MEIGIVGLGRVGFNMAKRLAHGGARVVAWDCDKAQCDELANEPNITMALMSRFSSQGKSDYARKLLAMMRAKFGGHAVTRHK